MIGTDFLSRHARGRNASVCPPRTGLYVPELTPDGQAFDTLITSAA